MTLAPLRCRVDSDCRWSFLEGRLGEESRERHEKDHRDWIALRDRIAADRRRKTSGRAS